MSPPSRDCRVKVSHNRFLKGTFLIRILPGHRWFLENLTELPLFGASVDYTCSPLSLVVIGVGTWVLLRGAKNSSLFNNVMTIANISVLLLVVVAGFVSGSVAPENFVPFVPHGFPSVIEGGGLVYVLNTDIVHG
jgi:amino acid transporter